MKNDLFEKLVAFDVMKKSHSNILEKIYKHFDEEDVAYHVDRFFTHEEYSDIIIERINEEKELRDKKHEENRALSRSQYLLDAAKHRAKVLDKPKIEYNLSLCYQLGIYVGEDLAYRYLPILSVDSEHLNFLPAIIKVSEEDCEKYKFFENNSENNWNDYINFRKELERRYLPKIFKCDIVKLYNITDMEELKKGIAYSLENSDRCYYSCDINDIKIYEDGDDYYTTSVIELILKND